MVGLARLFLGTSAVRSEGAASRREDQGGVAMRKLWGIIYRVAQAVLVVVAIAISSGAGNRW